MVTLRETNFESKRRGKADTVQSVARGPSLVAFHVTPSIPHPSIIPPSSLLPSSPEIINPVHHIKRCRFKVSVGCVQRLRLSKRLVRCLGSDTGSRRLLFWAALRQQASPHAPWPTQHPSNVNSSKVKSARHALSSKWLPYELCLAQNSASYPSIILPAYLSCQPLSPPFKTAVVMPVSFTSSRYSCIHLAHVSPRPFEVSTALVSEVTQRAFARRSCYRRNI